jgi:hypothetical protein
MPTRLTITLLGALALIAFPGAASAATTDDCQAQITTLRTDTANVTTFVNAKDQTGLLGKLDNASSALAAAKNGDAIRKLTDFRTKVQTLAPAGKLGADDAAQLDAEAAAAVSCIESIGT